MNSNIRRMLVSVLTCALSGIAFAAPARISVQANKPSHEISPLLWGVFFEDINLSADGGIYPERVRNRSFEDSEKPEYWTLASGGTSGSSMAVESEHPLNPLNRRNLRVNLRGPITVSNEGYWGMHLKAGDRYVVRLAARATGGFQGPLTVTLGPEANTGVSATVSGLTEKWQELSLDLIPATTDVRDRLHISASGEGTLWLDMVSVMPARTWKDHGLRPDLCEMLADLRPSFVRFPGGCWVEGDDMAHMYNWKKTVGSIAHRQPLWNIWQYWATHGLGYHEYLQLSEDLGAAPLFCINVGMSHREVVPMDQMHQWVQDALDAIEYANGPTNSVWGSLRARLGHPRPFGLNYLEIGNENGGPAYAERWPLFHRAIKARYPDLQLIANVWGGYPTNPAPDIIDEHYYNQPEFFMQQAHRYDSYDRRGPKVFVGEYAVTSGAGLGNLRGAIGEAAFMTGMERNSDVVVMAAYAPLFVHVKHQRWPINLINFDGSRVFGLPSYYVQQMFSRHRGDLVLPTTVDTPLAKTSPKGGAIGVGTWLTQAEFKDVKVTKGNQTLYTGNFTQGTDGWRLLGGGDWKANDGVLRQSSTHENVRAIAGDKSWTDYTYSLKARKLSGAEGFLILFNVQDDEAKSWWNLGGWGNREHGIEIGGVVAQKAGSIETGRWYDIRIELSDGVIRCYLDGQLVHEVTPPSVHSLYATASRERKSGDTILKVVNVAADPLEAEIKLKGGRRSAVRAHAVVLTSDSPTDENTLDYPTRVVPKSSTVDLPGAQFRHTFPGNSLTVLRVPNRK